ncbi:MAG: Na(+)/H(+) antiporter subunit B [Pseudomonadota bacterium]
MNFVSSIVLVDIALLAMLGVVAVAIIRLKSLFAIVMLSGVYSLVSATWFVAMDAVDVAFTEAAVGAGISTALMLGAMLLTARRVKTPDKAGARRWGPFLAVFATGGLLIFASTDLPAFGDPNSPANSYVGKDYIERTPSEVGPPNIVTAVLASYRGFDTFGETVVIFAAGVAVALLIGFGERALAFSGQRSVTPEPVSPDDHHMVLRVVSKLLIPLIALYAFYVQFHGDYGPGGGFQAGVIFAVAVILNALIFGLSETMDAVPAGAARAGAAFGVLLYGGVGVVNLLNGGAFLDYDYLFETPAPGSYDPHHWGQHFGILLVELGVLATVASTMIVIFYAFAGRAPEIRDEDW